MTENIVKDQEEFFNLNSKKPKAILSDDIFYNWANKEQFQSFEWLGTCENILEYGCGTGGSLDVLYKKFPTSNFKIVGVDIAEEALKKAKEYYPQHSFLKISNNKMAEIQDGSQDGAFMFHVLHHSTGHPEIYHEIFQKLKPGGKFVINDLTSGNPVVRLGRIVFSKFSKVFSPKFQEDLVVDEKIPDKYPVNVSKEILELERAGFEIVDVKFGHLFFFVFHWVDKFIQLSKFKIVETIYHQIIKTESFLVDIPLFTNFCEVVVIKAIKPSTTFDSVLNSGDYSYSFNEVVFNQISSESRVLDVGCWSGNLGKELIKEKNCIVDGIEINPKASNVALNRGYQKIYQINLNAEKLDFGEVVENYDYIVFADVLEHLINPEKVLKLVRNNLKIDGSIVVSLPNVAFIQNRINLMLGNWNYRSFGTLDKTHLRFYTIKTALELIEKCGYKVTNVSGYNQFGILKKLNFLNDISPELFGYQVLITAKGSSN